MGPDRQVARLNRVYGPRTDTAPGAVDVIASRELIGDGGRRERVGTADGVNCLKGLENRLAG